MPVDRQQLSIDLLLDGHRIASETTAVVVPDPTTVVVLTTSVEQHGLYTTVVTASTAHPEAHVIHEAAGGAGHPERQLTSAPRDGLPARRDHALTLHVDWLHQQLPARAELPTDAVAIQVAHTAWEELQRA